MHIITRARLVKFWSNHPDSEISLRLWYERAKQAQWQSFFDLREIFPSADQVKSLTVFNIGGNKYRLIAYINYARGKVFIRDILTHAEYDTNAWKKDPWFEEE